ncbi:MAG: hypothetical protein WA484_00625 [Solirubrobacteraceae bacterium]
MQGYQLHICRMARARLRASIGILALVTCTAGLVVCAPALAASRSAAQLRHAFAQTFLALRVTGNPAAACSLTTSEGQIALIQILRLEDLYLPSTTCAEAFAKRAEAEHKLGPLGLCNLPPVSEFRPAIGKAVVHVRGNRGTVRLVDDFICGGEDGRDLLTGWVAVALDPLGTSHWIRKRGRWLFDDQPTGTYSPAGRKAVAMLRAALSGSTITEPNPATPMEPSVAAFCANGSTNFTWVGTLVPDGPWYVTGGYPFTTKQHGPPFDAQGNPQGLVSLNGPISDAWGIKLVGGVLVLLPPEKENESVSLDTVTPGAAGC